MKGTGIGRYLTVLAILVVVLFGLSVLAPLSNGPLASASGATLSTSPTVSSAASSSAAATTAASTVTPSTVQTSSGAGPHPGTLEIYELAPGGAPTVDPAVAYYTVDDEPISNVYETLIAFNGTQTGPSPSDWVPEIATCVPGSAECLADTGSTLVFPNATTGAPQYYSFEISAGAKFYDPATKVSWPVYPTDVLFSFIRTLAFANLPAVGYNNGWIQAQALLPPGSPTYDNSIHYPYNNTPSPVFNSILINDTQYCPNPAGNLPINGCVTFNVGASGEAWPFFLELVSDPLGGSITPCGTFTYLGAGVPGFDGTTAAKGDGPCLMPGNGTSSSSASFKNWLSTVSPEIWDPLQELELTAPPSPQPAVQYTMVGSGPYYAVQVGVTGGGAEGSGGYTLAADPTYTAPEGCAGQPNCLPEAGTYIPNVVVYWQDTDTLGIEEAVAGQADTIQYDPTDTSTILDLVHTGTFNLLQDVLTGNNWNMMFELTFNTTNEAAIDPNGAGATNVPGNFLADLGLRQFLVEAFPYTTVQSTINTVDGVEYGINYGGAIPPGQTTYYPSNVTWPGCGGLGTCSASEGNPQTSPAVAGGAASWWQNITNPSGPYYDSELASCSSSTPCKFAIQGWVGNPTLDATIEAWIAAVKSLTGGAIQMYFFDITGSELYTEVGLGNGQGSLPVFNWGWVPDYGDPTDYMVPFWLPNGTFSFAQGLYSTFAEPQYNDVTACGHDDPSSWADLVYWANYAADQGTTLGIPSECQGIAYQTLVEWNALAAHEVNLTFRVLEYNLIEHIGNELAIEVYDYTQVLAVDYGTWLSQTGINLNPSVGGGGVQTWYTWVYADTVFQVSVQENTLGAGHTFSATLDGTTLSTTTVAGTSYLNFTGLANGTYPYWIGFTSGFGASPANGTAVINGANTTVSVAYTAFSGTTNTLSFTEGGLVSNTTWQILIQNVGVLSSNLPTIAFTLPVNTTPGWNYTPGVVVGYAHASQGTVSFDATAAIDVTVTYVGVILTTYEITFAPTGLPPTQTWSISLGSPAFTLTGTGNITFYEENGTYIFSIGTVTGYNPPASAGQIAIVGANLIVSVPFSTPGNGFDLTFEEQGLPHGSAWNVTVDGFGIQSTTPTLSFLFPNGTYNWSVSTIGGWTTDTWSGTAVVNGTTPPVTIKFVPFTYAVTFFEGGLTSGATWGVVVNGTSYTSPTYYLTVNLPNGTWAFSVPTIAGYLATPTSGNVTVAAAPTTQVIIFGPIPETFTVTFTASGLPTGATWTVFFDGKSTAGTATSVSFSGVVNNTYTYAILAPSGYTASPSGGTITVNGGNASQTITFTATTTPPAAQNQNFLGTLAYALIGLFVVLAVIFLALALYWRGRKPPTSAPPQSWESGTTDTKGTMESTDDQSATPPSS